MIINLFSDSYYYATITPVANQIRRNAESKEAWQEWMLRWCKLSLVGFLRSDVEAVLEIVGKEFEEELQPLSALLPWPEIAITGYSVFSILMGLEACLSHSVRAHLGLYTVDPMHTIKGGLSHIAWAFMNKNCYGWSKNVDLSKCIKFGLTVGGIEYHTATDDKSHNYVKVTCYNETSQEMEEHTADSVIISTPLHIVSEMTLLLHSPLIYKTLLLESAMQLLQRSSSRARCDSGKKKALWAALRKQTSRMLVSCTTQATKKMKETEASSCATQSGRKPSGLHPRAIRLLFPRPFMRSLKFTQR